MKSLLVISMFFVVLGLPATASDQVRFVQRVYVAGEPVVMDMATGLMWQGNYVTQKTWQQALAYCEGLNYGGFSDWRLPNINELKSLINYNKDVPASDFPNMPPDWFWSSSSVSGGSDGAWGVDFDYGGVYYGDAGHHSDARCVRLRP